MTTNQKICLWCKHAIPKSRKKSSLYCSDEHYYEAKKVRSSQFYENRVTPYKEIKRNEKILEAFFLFVELSRDIFYADLEYKKFNWGIAGNETLGPGNLIGKIVGRYAYHLNLSTKRVTLWKLKLKP